MNTDPTPRSDLSLRPLGALLIFTGLAAAIAHTLDLSLPTLRWFFSFTPENTGGTPSNWQTKQADIIGYAICLLLLILGVWLMAKRTRWKPNPMSVRRWQRFKSLRRGYLAFLTLIALIVLAMLDQALVGKRALFVSHNGQWFFPAFLQKQLSEKDFGGHDEAEPDYRVLKEKFIHEGTGTVILPIIPWDPTYDSDDTQSAELIQRDGLWYRPGNDAPYDGRAQKFYPFTPGTPENTRKIHSEYRFRDGKKEGEVIAHTKDGTIAFTEIWDNGTLISTNAAPGQPTWQENDGSAMTIVMYPPTPPNWLDRHFLGTTSNGWDVAAQIYGGLQVVLKAAIVYIAITYFLGILLGCAMGFFGGWLDLISQRLIEILSTIPFLLLIIVIVNGMGRDNSGLGVILGILCAFSWMDIATYMRTTAYREKSRDYIAAARVSGASTIRIIFRHLAPNALSTIVTLIPFSVVGVASSITVLDFIGFGLPDRYPSWGRTLADGLSNLDGPWIVYSVAVAMFFILLIFTFIGEAVREAFDPKKFTTYQ